MKPRNSHISFLVLAIWNVFTGITCIINHVQFRRREFLDGSFCSEGNVIHNTSCVSRSECLARCSIQSTCNGVFLEPDMMSCVTCSALFFTQSRSTGLKFYKRLAETGDSAYLLVLQRMTWDEAQENCEKLGGHLAIISSQTENEYIVEHLTAYDIEDNIWIGGKGSGGKEETFMWVDGSAVIDGYTNWRSGQPFIPLDSDITDAYISMTKRWSFQWGDNRGGSDYSVCEFE